MPAGQESLAWVQEKSARWDADKARVVGGVPPGVFTLPRFDEGSRVPGEWWQVREGDRVVGYGWMDATWNGAEILLAVDPAARRQGVGSFILDKLEDEAHSRGLNYLFNVVLPTHPDREAVTGWLERRGFHATDDGELRRKV